IKARIIDRTIASMAEEGQPFRGVLYAGLMLTKEGAKVLEFNVRFGDPETQVILPRIEDDLLQLLMESADGNLTKKSINQSQKACVTVVAASKGYPSSYQKGFEISGVDLAESAGCIVFHAGTKRVGQKILTNGGRVLNVTALGDSFMKAREKAYEGISHINFEGITYRTDIAKNYI
ncbi:MAG: phosphoribosylamine--glycine ligase, partial [Acidobacteria bacterium]|nr:phosphoribosylamine--glycine ligase [Acidobacteriota bacterium]